ncbi:hypothetical protein CK503_15885, partial [Aliifodinibius salipaludis]
TGGDSWANNSGWGSGDPSGSWHGVEVDANGRVVRLDLWKNGLQGQLPSTIGNLTKLTYLNVKGNKLTGRIPSEIGGMRSLEWLILSGRTYDQHGKSMKEPPQDFSKGYHPGKWDSATNDFSGDFPSTIGNLSNLERFELGGSSITDLPDELYNSTSLEGIYVNLNKNITNNIPSAIGNLTELRHLYFANNRMTGALPSSMSNLSKLTHLHLHGNGGDDPAGGFEGSLPDFSNNHDLRYLFISKNNFSGDWPTYWNNGNFQDLNTIHASWNEFTGPLHGFDNLPSLIDIGLSGNNLSGDLPDLTDLNKRTQIISLGWNNLTGELPQSGYPDWSIMKTIYLNDNNISGSIPCAFWNSIDNNRIGIVWLGNNDFSGNCTSAMNNLPSDTDISL